MGGWEQPHRIVGTLAAKHAAKISSCFAAWQIKLNVDAAISASSVIDNNFVTAALEYNGTTDSRSFVNNSIAKLTSTATYFVSSALMPWARIWGQLPVVSGEGVRPGVR